MNETRPVVRGIIIDFTVADLTTRPHGRYVGTSRLKTNIFLGFNKLLKTIDFLNL